MAVAASVPSIDTIGHRVAMTMPTTEGNNGQRTPEGIQHRLWTWTGRLGAREAFTRREDHHTGTGRVHEEVSTLPSSLPRSVFVGHPFESRACIELRATSSIIVSKLPWGFARHRHIHGNRCRRRDGETGKAENRGLVDIVDIVGRGLLVV